MSEGSLKSVVVLFAITYLASFFEQRKNFCEKHKEIEMHLASAGCVISIVLLTACIMIGIGFADVHIQDGNVPKALLLNGTDSIFYWGSIDITYIIFGVLFYPMFIHLLIEIVGLLKSRNIRVYELLKYLWKNSLRILACGIVGSALGIVICCIKYYLLNSINGIIRYAGTPQFYKYGILLGMIGIGAGIWYWGRKNIVEQKRRC